MKRERINMIFKKWEIPLFLFYLKNFLKKIDGKICVHILEKNRPDLSHFLNYEKTL